jgi:hypothetical protein
LKKWLKVFTIAESVCEKGMNKTLKCIAAESRSTMFGSKARAHNTLQTEAILTRHGAPSNLQTNKQKLESYFCFQLIAPILSDLC